MRITLLLLILSLPPLIEISSRSSRPADAALPAPRTAAAEARIPSIGMLSVVEAILIAGFAFSRRERQILDVTAEAAPARDGRRPRSFAWIS